MPTDLDVSFIYQNIEDQLYFQTSKSFFRQYKQKLEHATPYNARNKIPADSKKGLDNFRDYTSIARVTAVSPTNMKNFHVVHVINVILLRFAPYFREGKCAMF